MSGYSSRLLTDAIVAWLQGDGVTVGDGEKPAAAGFPYAVVYAFFTTRPTGSIVGEDSDAEAVYRIHSVGSTRQQCQWLADKVNARMRAAALTVAGLKVMRLSDDGRQPGEREDNVQPPIWQARDQYRVFLTTT